MHTWQPWKGGMLSYIRATRVHLQPLHDNRSLQQETGTKVYILHSLFDPAWSLIAAVTTKVVDHIDAKFSAVDRQMTLTSR